MSLTGANFSFQNDKMFGYGAPKLWTKLSFTRVVLFWEGSCIFLVVFMRYNEIILSQNIDNRFYVRVLIVEKSYVPLDCGETLCDPLDSEEKLCVSLDSGEQLCVSLDSEEKLCFSLDSGETLCFSLDCGQKLCVP